MDDIKLVLNQWMKEQGITPDKLLSRYDTYLQHPSFLQWWREHPEWKAEQLLPFMPKIKEYVKEHENCQQCLGLRACNNLMHGHYAELDSYNRIVEVAYKPCKYLIKEQEAKKRHTLVRSHQIPRDIIEASIWEVDDIQDKGREEAFEAVLDFAKHAEPGKSSMGLFLYGPLGVGKSYLLGAACNALAERNIASYMVYTPDFFREMKGAIAEQNLEEKLQVLKEIPVLIFDDIGAENISGWARDEILGAILQYRIMERLPTLYTSNYDYNQLEEHLAYSQKGGIEQLKAKRIMERIRHYTKAYFLEGRNRRAHQG